MEEISYIGPQFTCKGGKFNKIISIYINKILHLRIVKEELISIRSFYISKEKDPDPYFIELIYKSNKVTCQYDTKEKWLSILTLIDQNLWEI